MSMDLKTAVVQHALDVAQLYKDNCALGRSLPEASPRLRVGLRPEAPAPVQPQPSVPVPPANVPSVPSDTASGWPAWAKAAAIGAAMLGAGGAGAAATNYWLGGDTGPTIVEQGDESLLQSLEDRGFHLPPEQRVTQ